MKARHVVEYLAVIVLRAVLSLMPRRAASWCGRRLGDIYFAIDRRHRKEVLENLALAFGSDLSRREKQRIARGAYRHFGGVFFDFIRSPVLSPKKIEKIAEFEGWENLERAFDRGRGVLILTAHYGYWELMGVAQGYRGRPLSVVARRLDNPLLERMLQRYRTRSGNVVIYKQNAIREVFRALRRNESVAVLIDQNMSPKQGVFVDFFGVPASTTPILSAVALKTGAPIVPAFSMPMPGGKWKFIYEPPLELGNNGDRGEALVRVTQECTNIIERHIRERPEIWLWMHRRWKSRPEGEAADSRGSGR